MNLQMDGRKADNYSSNAQKIRVITEDWVNNNMFCPYCGNNMFHILKITDQLLISFVHPVRKSMS